MSKFQGIQSVEWRPAGAANWDAAVALNNVLEEGTENPVEIPEDDKTGRGDSLYAGERRPFTFSCPELDKYAALRAKMVADEAVDLRMTDVEGNKEVIVENWIPKVWKPKGFTTGRRNVFFLKVTPFII